MFQRPNSLAGLEPLRAASANDLVKLMSSPLLPALFGSHNYLNSYLNMSNNPQSGAAAALMTTTSHMNSPLASTPSTPTANRNQQQHPYMQQRNWQTQFVPTYASASSPVQIQAHKTSSSSELELAAPQAGSAPIARSSNATSSESFHPLEEHLREGKPSVEELRLRHKRERNRRAAANCRRRKEEKIKQLEEENSLLKQELESLKASIVVKPNCSAGAGSGGSSSDDANDWALNTL